MDETKTNKTATSVQETINEVTLPFGLSLSVYANKCHFYEEHLQPICANKQIA